MSARRTAQEYKPSENRSSVIPAFEQYANVLLNGMKGGVRVAKVERGSIRQEAAGSGEEVAHEHIVPLRGM